MSEKLKLENVCVYMHVYIKDLYERVRERSSIHWVTPQMVTS